MSVDVQVVDDPAGEAARRLAAARGNVVLTGGSTPRGAYARAAELRDDWSGVEFWFSDERCVPPDHEHSNFGMARAALLRHAAGSRAHRMEGERGPHEGAGAYERELQLALGEGMPELDLVLLGLGPDGHCASLFPGHRSLEVRDHPVTGVEQAGLEPFVARVTLTLPVINAAREVVFLATGEGKAEAAVRAFAGPTDPATPASLVSPRVGALVVMLDEAAASRLPGPLRGPGG